jgi:deoxycytidylate deaminase
MKKEEINFLMGVAKLAGSRSKARRLRVGGVVTDAKGNLVAAGFNGGIRGLQNEVLEKKIYEHEEGIHYATHDAEKYPYSDEFVHGSGFIRNYYRLVTDETIAIHAEQNLLAHAARRGISIDGGTAVITHSPCGKCCGLLIQAGITDIIFEEKYRLFDEIDSQYGKYVRLHQFKNSDFVV